MRKLLFQGIIRSPLTEPAPAADDAELAALAASLDAAARRRLGRSLSIREVDAGSCNACELEIHALSNAFYDLERFGLRFVASPRHADVLMATGPVTKNMREALERRTRRHRRRNGWSRSAIAPSTAEFLPAPTRSPAVSRPSFRSTSPSVVGGPPSPTRLKGLLALLEFVLALDSRHQFCGRPSDDLGSSARSYALRSAFGGRGRQTCRKSRSHRLRLRLSNIINDPERPGAR